MPTINKLPKKEKKTVHNDTYNRVARRQVYGTQQWRKLREQVLREQPICQECLKEGKVYAGSEGDPLQVHHIKSFFKNGQIDWDLAYNKDNLETICSYHHGLEHQKNREKKAEQIIKELDGLFNEVK